MCASSAMRTCRGASPMPSGRATWQDGRCDRAASGSRRRRLLGPAGPRDLGPRGRARALGAFGTGRRVRPAPGRRRHRRRRRGPPALARAACPRGPVLVRQGRRPPRPRGARRARGHRRAHARPRLPPHRDSDHGVPADGHRAAALAMGRRAGDRLERGALLAVRSDPRDGPPEGAVRLLGGTGDAGGALRGLATGFGVILTPANLYYCFLGSLVGTLVGVLPGIGPLAALSLLLPFTFPLPPVPSLVMLAAIFYGAMYGGSTTSILVNIPDRK